MPFLRELGSRLRGVFGKRRHDADLNDEFAEHLDLLTEENIRRGMSLREARAAARHEFGAVEQIKETYRDRKGLPMLESFTQDLRFGARTLRKNPGFTAVAVLTLALGIGANTAIFSVCKAVLLNSLPYSQPDRLVQLAASDSQTPNAENVSFGGAQDYKERNHSFQSISLYRGWGPIYSGSGRPQSIPGLRVSYDFFDTLGVIPILGRNFERAEDRPDRRYEVILSYSFWKEQFGGRPEVVGQSIRLSEVAFQIVGVLPESFQPTVFMNGARSPELWAPLGYDMSQPFACRTCQHLHSVARLAEGVSIGQARAQINSIVSSLVHDFPKDYSSDYQILVRPLDEVLVGKIRTSVWFLLGATGLVLLIACANTTNLLLSRGALRRREMAVRAALGAGPLRLARQLLTETTLITLLGGASGVLLASLGLRGFIYWAPINIPRLGEIRLDGGVLLFTVLASMLTGLVVGAVPAIAAARADQRETLQQGSRGTEGMAHRRLRHILIAAEVALAFLLTLGTGLLLKSLHRVLDVDPGFRTHNLYISGYALIGSRYAKDDVVKQFERDALDHLRSIPGVDSISTVSTLPLNGGFDQRGLFIKERPLANDADGPSVDAYYIGTDYFRTMGIRLVRGRAFTTADGATPLAPVAIVSEKAARTFWPNQDPIGSHIQLGSHDETKPYATIVGIAADVLQYGLDSVPTPEAYALDTYEADTSPGIVLRSQLSPNALQKAIEQQIATLDKGAPVTDLVSMDHVVSKSLAQRKFLATLIGCFGFLALLLSVVGIYGVMAYQVAQRTNEIGIRMALGATPLAILRLVVREGMIWALSGVVAGAVASVALKQLLASQLFGIRTTDPITVALAAGVLGLCAFLACFIPARRATRVDPLVALRYM